MKSIITSKTIYLYAGILTFFLNSLPSYAINCPQLTVDRKNELKKLLSGESDDWKVGFHYGADKSNVLDYISYNKANISAPKVEQDKNNKEYCEYDFTYQTILSSWGPYSFVLYERGVEPQLKWSVASCVKSAIGYVCTVAKEAQAKHKQYVDVLKQVRTIAMDASKTLSKKSAHEAFIKNLDDLIALESGEIAKIISDAKDKGVKQVAMEQVKKRTDLIKDMLENLENASLDNTYKSYASEILKSAAWAAAKKGLGI